MSLDLTGATCGTAIATLFKPKKADPATPRFTMVFIDCFQFSWLVVGCWLECNLDVLEATTLDTWYASHATSRTERTTTV